MYNILFSKINWEEIPKVEYPGESSTSFWRTVMLDNMRVRVVDYLPGYLADHWCQKGHIVHCLEGEFINELENGEKTIMRAGDTYVVSDRLSSHRSSTRGGARLLIIDGEFLNPG